MDSVLMREIGNRECVELLRKWLEIAEKGAVNHVALAVVIAMDRIVTEAVGEISAQPEMFIALDQLKARISQGIASRVAPVDPSLPANHVCFNAAMGIMSYDFLPWIIGAEMHRIREGASDPLKVSFFRVNSKELQNSPYHSQMLQNVVCPLIQAIGGETAKVAGGKNDFPVVYRDVVAAAKRGESVPRLHPTDAARDMLTRIIGDMPPFVTITLRESEHFAHRNSNLEAWLKFAKWLEGKGEEVIFVRDTAKADEDLEYHSVLPPASKDLHIRLALYERAKHNLFISNGPATLNWHLDSPFTMFIEMDEKHQGTYAPAWPGWWQTRMGVEMGEQFPWFGEKQRIVWKKDSFDNLCEAWEQQSGSA